MRLAALLRWPAFLAGLIVVYLYLIFVLCPRVIAAEPTNGLTNPGFENGLDSWTWSFAGSPYASSSTTVHSGGLAAVHSIPIGGNASQDYWSELYQIAAISPGQSMTFSGYMHTSFAPASTVRVGLMAQYLDANGIALGDPIKSSAAGGVTNWKLLTLSSPAAPAGAISVRLSMYVWAARGDALATTGEADFDDFLFTLRYQQPTPTLTLSNTGFENGLNDWDSQYGFPFQLDSGVVFAGVYSASHRVPDSLLSERDYWSELYQVIKVKPTEPLHLTAQVRTTFPAAATAKAGLIAQYMDAAGNVLATTKSAVIGGTTDWRLLELSYRSAPAGAVNVRLSAFVWAAQNDTVSTSGAAYFDELFFEKKYVPAMLLSIYLNPGFESGIHDWLQNWGFPYKLENTIRYQGGYGVSNAVDPGLLAAQAYYADIYQLLKPAGPLYASGWVKTTFPIAATAKAGIMIEFLNANDVMIGKSRQPIPVGGTTDWRLLEVFVPAPPAGTAKARIGGFLWAAKNDTASLSGKAYFDSMSVERVVRRPDYPADFRNPGFETGLHDWLDQYAGPATLEAGPAVGGTGIVRNGQYAASKTINTVSVRDYYSQMSQDLSAAKLKADGAQWAVIYAKTTFAKTSLAKAGLQVQFLNINGAVISQRKVQFGGPKDWTQLRVSVDKMPAGTYLVRIMSYVYAPLGNKPSLGGKAYFDDAGLSSAQPVPPNAFSSTLDEPPAPTEPDELP